MALDHGPRGTAALQALYHTLTRPRIGQDLNVCSICKIKLSESYIEHYSICHTPILNPELIVDCLAKESGEVFDYAKHFI